MDEKTHLHFMGIMGEMVVMYYDHTYCTEKLKIKGSEKSFERFCDTITRFLNQPSSMTNIKAESEEGVFIAWLMLELGMEYGLNDKLSAEVVVSFFNDCYYRDIYRIQKVANDYLFPNGYYNRRQSII